MGSSKVVFPLAKGRKGRNFVQSVWVVLPYSSYNVSFAASQKGVDRPLGVHGDGQGGQRLLTLLCANLKVALQRQIVGVDGQGKSKV